MDIRIIAKMRSSFPSKFGIPRQSGLAPSLSSKIVFEPEYRSPEALRGLGGSEGFSHIWIIWEFSECVRDKWSPTVRPPRLGGNKRMGVFATRSPYRPNPIGLSCVKIERIEMSTSEGPVIYVSGADLMDGTPIYDIKPYLPHIDGICGARGGFSSAAAAHTLKVVIPDEYMSELPSELIAAVTEILSGDPRPSYQDDPNRLYGFVFEGYEIKFVVSGSTLTVCSITAAV